MVSALLLPSIVKLQHHHLHFECNAKNQKHLHAQREKCLECSFEFSVYAVAQTLQHTPITEVCDRYLPKPYRCSFDDASKFSFLLRGPPVFTNRTL
jgi:hypothetical protein